VRSFANASVEFSQAVLDSEAAGAAIDPAAHASRALEGDALAVPQPIVLRKPTDAELADFKREFDIAFGAGFLRTWFAAEGDQLTPERARELAVQALAEDGAS
jgi:hypothetical protein